MHEYIYYSQEELDFPLDESIYVTSNLDETKDKAFLISNSYEVGCELIADEIEFYQKNTQDSLQNKISNIKKLYELAELKLDNAKDFLHTISIGNRLLLITNNNDDAKSVMEKVDSNEFELFHIEESIIKTISGSIGNLEVIVNSENKDVTLSVDQIIWFGAKEEGLKQSGTFDPLNSSIDIVLETIRKNIISYSYKNFLTYDKSICQYHERREEICSKCEEVCPTVAITKIDEEKHLKFSDIDCLGCGGCVSVCPSGSLDYAPMDKDSIFQLSLHYKNTHPLIIPDKMQLRNLSVNLKENILPFKIEGEKFLDETTLLTLAQTSSSQLIFYTDVLSKGTTEAVNMLNEIYQRKYGKNAVLLAKTQDELQDAIDKACFIKESYFNFNQQTMKKREAFSYRLQNIIGDDDLGVITTGPNIHYGVVKVNESNCTLCLSCVGACNVDALIADAKTFELKVNPSLCTSCGYCEISCAEENCLTIEQDIINLNKIFFTENILAKDKLFACIECGKEFATTKAIEKVASMMKPFFASNPTKERTLYCCEDCKAKLMIKQGLLDA